MDWEYMGQLLMSVMIFAPGVVLLVGALFVGGLILLERGGLLGRESAVNRAGLQPAATASDNPPEGQVIAGLRVTIEQQARAAAQLEPDAKTATGGRRS